MLVTLICRVSHSLTWRLLVAAVFLVIVMAFDLVPRSPVSPPARARWPMPDADFSRPPSLLGQGSIPMPAQTPAAHSSSLLAMPTDHSDALLAFWFAGTQESAADVGIAMSGFERHTQQWRPAAFVVERQALGRQLGFGVRRLGNPVAWLDAQGRVHLFVVATGLGGWAASRIVHLRQSLEQKRPLAQAGQALPAIDFDAVRVLPLSWWWNTSYLVRTQPLPLQDGGMLLPVHFELGIKYPVALRFDAQGVFKGMVRMSARTHLLQPALAALSETGWLALLRDQRQDGRITLVQSQDAGQHWQDLPDLALTNPDASIAAIALAPGQLWLAHNSSRHSRNWLDLSHSLDGESWQPVWRLAQGSGADEYSYPALAWADDSLWVSYTDQRKRIAWQRFAWPKR
ncbi:MAG: exo-alpha-sialidase [Rhodoferax sp.]|jgi:predicted neuraminidase|nr:exo-alpha-sialidase [Rhodoferax sp.]